MGKVFLKPEEIERMRVSTGQEWRPCQRKKHTVFACRIPAGYIFVDKVAQQKSYEIFHKAFNGREFVLEEEVFRNKDVYKCLVSNGCYKTDGKSIVVCGVCGELYNMSEERFRGMYSRVDGRGIDKIKDNAWFEAVYRGDYEPQFVGIQVSSNGKSEYVLILSKSVNDSINYNDVNIVSNDIFALTYNLNVGGWSRLIGNTSGLKKLTLRDILQNYSVKNQEMPESGSVITHNTNIDKLKKICDTYNLHESYEKIMQVNDKSYVNIVIGIFCVLDRYVREERRDLRIFDDYYLDKFDNMTVDLRIAGNVNGKYLDYHLNAYEKDGSYRFDFYGWGRQHGENDDAYECDLLNIQSVTSLYNSFVEAVNDCDNYEG